MLKRSARNAMEGLEEGLQGLMDMGESRESFEEPKPCGAYRSRVYKSTVSKAARGNRMPS